MEWPASPEERLCLLLARHRPSPGDLDEVERLAAGNPDWNQLSRLAIDHKVYPQIYRNLSRLPHLRISPQAMLDLKNHYQMNSMLNELWSAELVRVLAEFERRGIPTIPLKGLPLADALFGDLSLRVCGDIDLLVAQNQVAVAMDALESLGYQADFPRWIIRDHMLANTVQIQLSRQSGSIAFLVEIHWGMFQMAAREQGFIAEIWRTSLPAKFRGAAMRKLTAEWELLYLLAHIARHNWQGLRWLVDIDAACTSPLPIDSERLIAQARMAGWEQIADWGLGVCRLLLETPSPLPQEPSAPYSRAKLLSNLNTGTNRWQAVAAVLRTEPSILAKAGFLLRKIFAPTPADYAVCNLPESVAFLYYAIRPMRLAVSSLHRALPVGHGE